MSVALSRLAGLFEQALELPPARWPGFAQSHCADDPALAAQLLRLLALEQQAGQEGLEGLEGLPQVSWRLQGESQPTAIGPYAVTALLGEGGMGRVYAAARDVEGVRQDVAIKLLRRDLLAPESLRRFARERQILARLEHPGIGRFIDAGSLADGTPYVVMERICGTPLLAWCDAQRLDLAARLRLFRAVLAAVAHAHRNLIVHRDLKSGNILVDAQGQPRLLDFGIAKPLLADTEHTRTIDRCFTLGNVAPEQLRGEPVGVACDVYALGVLLYELLCGLPPLDLATLTPGQAEHAVLETVPSLCSARPLSTAAAQLRGLRSGSELQHALRGDLEQVALRCLRKAPAQRYASVDHLDADLAAIQEHRPIAARGGERVYRFRRWLRRHRMGAALVATIVLGLLGGAWTSWRHAAALALERNRAVAERDLAQASMRLLQDAFRAADPARSAQGRTTAAEVLQAARGLLDRERTAHPRLYATLAGTIGEVELALGLDPVAAEVLAEAVEAAAEAQMPPEERHPLQILLARAWVAIGRLDDAAGLLKRVGAEGAGTRPDWQLAHAAQLRMVNHADHALAPARTAVRATRHLSPSHPLRLDAAIQLALVLEDQDQPAAALETLDGTLVALQGDPDHDGSSLRLQLQRLSLLARSGKAAQALQDISPLQQAIAARYGAESPLAARLASVEATIHHQLKQVELRSAAYARGLRIWRQTLGDAHPQTFSTALNYAWSLSADDDAAKVAALTEALRIGERTFGADENPLVMVRTKLAEQHLRQQRPADALAVLDQPAQWAALRQSSAGNRARALKALDAALGATYCARPSAQCAAVRQRATDIARVDR